MTHTISPAMHPAHLGMAITNIALCVLLALGSTQIQAQNSAVKPGEPVTPNFTGAEIEAVARTLATLDADQAEDNAHGLGRELFGGMRRTVRSAEEGAITWL